MKFFQLVDQKKVFNGLYKRKKKTIQLKSSATYERWLLDCLALPTNQVISCFAILFYSTAQHELIISTRI